MITLMNWFVWIVGGGAVVCAALKLTALLILAKDDVTWGVIATVATSIISPIIFKLYFMESVKRDRKKWLLGIGMAVDIFSLATAANAVTGTTDADWFLLVAVILQGLGWIYPHIYKKAK